MDGGRGVRLPVGRAGDGARGDGHDHGGLFRDPAGKAVSSPISGCQSTSGATAAVLPCCNHGQHLPFRLDTVLNRTVFLDDGATDGSPEVAADRAR